MREMLKLRPITGRAGSSEILDMKRLTIDFAFLEPIITIRVFSL